MPTHDRLFFCLASLTTAVIAISTIPMDRPKGYIQRVALGALGYLMCGYSLGYLGLISTDENYRPILLMILIAVELNDVFAYTFGKTFKGPKLIVNTSPNKTISGALGAAVSTTLLTAWMAHFVLRGSRFDHIGWLLLLGLLVSGLGQLGDLVVSSIKRDLGVKDIGKTIPGHGGVLDRFDSLLLVPPAVYHLISIVNGPLGSGQAARILTGGS
jgi:phosphatidate cytidylyltransferase